MQGVVEVQAEVNGVQVNVGQQLIGDSGQPRLGVAHGGRRVAVHAAKVTLPVNQWVAHGKELSHAYQGVIHRRVAVRVVLAQHLADDTGALAVGLVGPHTHLVHCVEDAPLHRLQPVSHIGQGPGDDNAHGVAEVGGAHLIFDADGRYMAGGWGRG